MNRLSDQIRLVHKATRVVESCQTQAQFVVASRYLALCMRRLDNRFFPFQFLMKNLLRRVKLI